MKFRDIRDYLRAEKEPEKKEEAPKVDLASKRLVFKVEQALGDSGIDAEALVAAIKLVVKDCMASGEEPAADEAEDEETE